MSGKEKKKKGLLKKFVAASGSNPTTMLAFCWLALAYLIPVFFLPWALITFALHALGLPKFVSIVLAFIPALVGLRLHMQWRQ